MSTGFITGTKDLDQVFAPYYIGTHPSPTGYNATGWGDIYTRYAPLVYGTQAPATGFITGTQDLNQLFAAYGTAMYALPFNGQTYSSAAVVNSSGGYSGKVWLTFAATTTTWSIIASYQLTNSSGGISSQASTLASGTFPGGWSSILYTATRQSGVTATITNQAATETALSSSPTIQALIDVIGQSNYSIGVDVYAGASLISTNTMTWILALST